METLIGLAIIYCQIAAAVIMFGGWVKCPTRMRITIGVGLMFMLIAVIGMSM